MTPINPTIKIRHVAATTWSHDDIVDPLDSANYNTQMTQLSHLEFLPICLDAQGKPSPPTVMTFRTYMPASISHYSQDVFTIADQWELREKAPAVHPAFEQLSSRRNSVGSQPPVRCP
jgi:mediator of RNA polymerase II transcription subunit 16